MRFALVCFFGACQEQSPDLSLHQQFCEMVLLFSVDVERAQTIFQLPLFLQAALLFSVDVDRPPTIVHF